jgi:hypothetical protein
MKRPAGMQVRKGQLRHFVWLRGGNRRRRRSLHRSSEELPLMLQAARSGLDNEASSDLIRIEDIVCWRNRHFNSLLLVGVEGKIQERPETIKGSI